MKKVLLNAWFWFGIFLIALFFIMRFIVLPLLDKNFVQPIIQEPNRPVTVNIYKAEPLADNLTYMKQAEYIGLDCQYPDRFYADGNCDNSDPACPETLKDPLLRGDC